MVLYLASRALGILLVSFVHSMQMLDIYFSREIFYENRRTGGAMGIRRPRLRETRVCVCELLHKGASVKL